MSITKLPKYHRSVYYLSQSRSERKAPSRNFPVDCREGWVSLFQLGLKLVLVENGLISSDPLKLVRHEFSNMLVGFALSSDPLVAISISGAVS